MADGAGVLRLEDIHSHWQIDKTTNERNDENKTESEDENTGNEEDTVEALLQVNEPAIAKPRGRPRGAKNKKKTKKRTRQQAFEDSTQREPSGFEYILARRQEQQQQLAAAASQIVERAASTSTSEQPSQQLTSELIKASGVSGLTGPIETGLTETTKATNDSDDDSITSDMMVQLALSEDPQLEERMMRLGTGVDDFSGRLQKSLDDHIYNTQRDQEGVKEDSVKWQRVWAMRVRHKLIRKQFFYAIDEDNIPPPPQFDTSIDGVFKKHDQFRSIAERLHGWAVCDANKDLDDNLNPLRHSPEQVLGYWKKHNPQHAMPTNPLPTNPLPPSIQALATTQSTATAPVRLLAQRP